MKIRRILISYKRTTYQLYVKRRPTQQMRRLVATGHDIAVDMQRAHLAHLESIAHVKAVLQKYKIATTTQGRNFLESVTSFDLILSIGGDGTFLRTSHFIGNAPPILGINSSPDHSVGALTSIASPDFEEKLVAILEDRVKILACTRLECVLNGKVLKEPILNDALVTNECPAAATRIIMVRGSYREEQKNSGVWIATPTGSTAAIGAAGGTPMPRREAKKFQYVSREPYHPLESGHRRYRLIHGVLQGRESLRFVSQMGKGRIYIDGPRVHYPFNFGDEAVFRLSRYPLHVIR